MPQAQQIKSFITQRLEQLSQDELQTTDLMSKLVVATKRVSFSNILSQYFGQHSQVIQALMAQVSVYMQLECYEQAQAQAMLARRKAEDRREQKLAIQMLIAECMLKQHKLQDAYGVLLGVEKEAGEGKTKKEHLIILVKVLFELGYEEKLRLAVDQLEQATLSQSGRKSEDYAFLLIQKGDMEFRFHQYQMAIKYMSEGIDLLVELRCQQKKRVMDVYLKMAKVYRVLEEYKKEYSSLVCAQSMAKQLADPHKHTISISHLLIANLKNREEPEKMLQELEKVKQLEEAVFGDSSVQFGKTLRQMADVLRILNRKAEAKACQNQSTRIMGESKDSRVLQTQNLNWERKS